LNILTKICVVILLVLVLFASFTFINMATVPQNWRQLYTQKDQEATLNAQAAREQMLVANNLSNELKSLRAKADQLAVDLAEAKKDKVVDPAVLQMTALQSAIDTANTRLADLQLNVEAMAKRNEKLTEQLDEARKAIASLQKVNRDAIAEITQTRGKLERSERVVQALQSQLRDRDERIIEQEKLLATPHVAGGEAKAAPVISAKITGAITSVRGELASINIGSAQGVIRGVKLYIYRNASFVGYLRIDEVDEGESAGTIIDKQLDPTVGDKVTSDLQK
jgi:F0F1-type ATP synthase membrane subunit b/b'